MAEFKIPFLVTKDEISGDLSTPTTVKDTNDKDVLRIVDSAPFAYNPDYDAKKVDIVNDLPRFEFIPTTPQLGIQIDAGLARKVTLSDEIFKKYNKIRISVVTDSEGSYRVELIWRSTLGGVLSSVVGEMNDVIETTDRRSTYLIEDILSDNLEIVLRNRDSVSHTYDLHLFGIRT